MNSAEKPHWNANSSVSSILRRYPVFRISKPFLSRFITASSRSFHFHARVLRSRRIQPVQTSGKYCRDRPPEEQRLFHQKLGRAPCRAPLDGSVVLYALSTTVWP